MKKQQITHIKTTAPSGTDNIANGYNIGQWWQNTTTGKKYFHKTDGVWIDIESVGGGATWGGITGTLSDQTDLQTALDGKVIKNAPITPDTKTKITYDEKGLVTDGDGLAVGDIPTLPQSKITNLTTDLSLKQDELFDFHTKKGYFFFEDFVGGTDASITQGSGVITSATGTSAFAYAGEIPATRTNQQGTLVMLTGTTATGTSRCRLGASGSSSFSFGNGIITFETSVFINTLSDVTNTFWDFFGFASNTLATPVNAIGFVYDTGLSFGNFKTATSPNFKCYNYNGSTATWTTTTVPVTAGQWYKLTIIINADRTQVTFFIDNVLVATHTTGIPTAGSVHIEHVKTAGTTTRLMYLDYIALKQIYTTPRT